MNKFDDYRLMSDMEEGESIMQAQLPQVHTADTALLSQFEITKEVITNIRNIRLQKNIPAKQSLDIFHKGNADNYYDSLIGKIETLELIQIVVLYNVLAFGLQSVFGAATDKVGQPHIFSIIG